MNDPCQELRTGEPDPPDERWPPFAGLVVENMACPNCDAEDVNVRVDSSEDPRPAYCGTCHAMLTVEVFETFGCASPVNERHS